MADLTRLSNFKRKALILKFQYRNYCKDILEYLKKTMSIYRIQVSIMLASGVGALTYGFLFLTIVLWFTALIVPSWFVFSMTFEKSKILVS